MGRDKDGIFADERDVFEKRKQQSYEHLHDAEKADTMEWLRQHGGWW